MNYKESFFYSQQMMNKILQSYRNFAQSYINNLIIFSKILKNYKKHLSIIFYYAQLIESLQNKKTILFCKNSITGKSQKKYCKKTQIDKLSILEHKIFENI